MSNVNELVEFLLANPLFLVPILFAAAMIVFAILKKLLKLAAIGAIAAALYILLVEYFGLYPDLSTKGIAGSSVMSGRGRSS